MSRALRLHWPEYLMEAAGLGIFMVSASLFAALLYHPASAVARALAGSPLQRPLMGLAMGLTAVALIYSPWGRQSGAHFNPVVTVTFLRLGKIAGWDALFYVVAQLAGGLAAMLLVASLLDGVVGHPSVNYVVTVPGPPGAGVAFLAELAMTFGLMSMVLAVSNTARLARFTGLLAGMLVAVYITVEAPLSGMSLNPARTLASASAAAIWTAFWIYVTAPLLGMLLAAELHVRHRRVPVRCAKLHHDPRRRCIFRCGYAAPVRATGGA